MAKEKFDRNKKYPNIGEIEVKKSNRDSMKELELSFDRLLRNNPDRPIADWSKYEKLDTILN